MSLPLLILTDGTTTVDLLSRTGYHLTDWRPAITPFKNDGIRRSSVISEGSRLVGYQYDNVIETFTLDLDERAQDGAARQLILLNRLLVKGVDYWARGGVNDPVWIEARSGDEQYTRYATVMNYKMESIGNPYGAEFLGSGSEKLGMSELVLTVERGHWMENPPKVGTGQEIHNTWENLTTHQIAGRTDYAALSVTTQQVFVGNRFSNNNITHVFTCTAGGAWSANIVGSAFPQALLPNPVGTGDMVYFGIVTNAGATAGPFSSLILDLAIPGAFYAGGATGQWQYWNNTAGAWHTLHYPYDRTSGAGGTSPLHLIGVLSVHWNQAEVGHSWTTYAVPGMPGGITGWWVRMIVTIPGGGSISVPYQQNREVYTANEGYVQIDDDDISGDVDALSAISVCPRSEMYQVVTDMYRDIDYLIVGLRSLDREMDYLGATPTHEVFNAYLNFSDVQQPTWLSTTLLYPAACSFTTAPQSSTGRAVYFNVPGAAAFTDIFSLHIDSQYVASYYGVFRAFIRYYQFTGADGSMLVTLSLKTDLVYGGTTTWATISSSAPASSLLTANWGILDMGIISMPGMPIDARVVGNATKTLHLTVSIATIGVVDAYFYDLVLIPVDEWVCQVETPQFPSTSGKVTVADAYQLVIDSISMPTELIVSKISTPYVYSGMRTVANGRAILHPRRDQRYWFFAARHVGVSGDRVSVPEITLSTSVNRSQRYLTLRGSE